MAWPRIDWIQIRDDLQYAVLRSRGAHHRLTVSRSVKLGVAGLLFLWAQVALRFFWVFDALFFGRWRTTEVRRPLFVIGNFRSGTTLLFRMLQGTGENTTSLTTWEIYLAPTVSQRLMWRGIGIVDRFIGSPMLRVVREINAVLQRIPYHPIDVFEPEEDAGALMYTWTGFFTWFLFPRRDTVPASAMIDELPPRRRRIAMEFYRDILKKHLYAVTRHRVHGAPVLISKNPAFTGAVEALRGQFPDARFVQISREWPATTESSSSWFQVWFHLLGNVTTATPNRSVVERLVATWHGYPRRFPVDQVELSRLVATPRSVLRSLIRRHDLHWLRDRAQLDHALGQLQRDHGSGGSEGIGGSGIPRPVFQRSTQHGIFRSSGA